MQQHNGSNLNAGFEMRQVTVDRTKKRLDKYRKTSESRAKSHLECQNAHLARDIADTNKYLSKVTEQKQRKKSGRDKKDEKPGVDGLSKTQRMAIRHDIMSNIRADKSNQKLLSDNRPNAKKEKESKKSSGYTKPLNFDPSINSPFPESLPNPMEWSGEIGEIAQDDLENILGNGDAGNGNASQLIIKDEPRNSPTSYHTLQPSNQPTQYQAMAAQHANYYTGYYPNLPNVLPQSQMQQRYQGSPYGLVPPPWGPITNAMIPPTSSSYQFTPNDSEYPFMDKSQQPF